MHEEKITQDEITITLKAQKIVVHETVRVNVTINAQVDPEQSESGFRTEIHSSLRKFIDTEWKIQSIQRFKGTGKFEQVTVMATARVPEHENSKLVERANAITRMGFELSNPTVDYSLTFDEVQEVNRELRQILFLNAIEECHSYNTTLIKTNMGGYANFRVSDSQFNTGNLHQNISKAFNNAYNVASMGATVPVGGAGAFTDQETDACSPGDGGSSDLNVSTRFEMTGTFILRAVRS